MDIRVLTRQGYSKRAIAKKLGLHRDTVTKYLESEGMPAYRTVSRKSALAPYHGLIDDLLSMEKYRATRIHELVAQQGYEGSYETVKRYVRGAKEKRGRTAYVRFETMPGQQAQVDFGDFQVALANGSIQTVYAFVMVLGYSRHLYVEFVERCTMPVFLDCHQNAFLSFGGVPAEILYDNMKNVVVRRHVGKAEFNATFLDFGTHYGFKPVACPPYSPWYKGKVERPIDYIRERFWRGYLYRGLEQANRDMASWNRTVAADRIHGTTRERISERFNREQATLGPLPGRFYDTAEKVTRKVYRDCQIALGGNRYVVPHTLVGKTVLVKIKDGTLRVYDDEILCAEYRLATGKGHLTAHPRFYEALRADEEQARRKYRAHAGKGKATRGLLKEGIVHALVQRRPLSVYDALLGSLVAEEVAHV